MINKRLWKLAGIISGLKVDGYQYQKIEGFDCCYLFFDINVNLIK